MAVPHRAPAGELVVRPFRLAAVPVRSPHSDAELQRSVLGDLIGASPAMQTVLATMTRLAPHARATLITGEHGTGKATLARALHRLGPQRTGKLHTAAEVDPWQHVDARSTIFFPDIGDLSNDAQAGLTRAMAEASHAPAGEGLHVIAASDGDLRRAVEAGRFRADLYYRLSVFELHLPPLRERLDDVPALAAAFVRATCAHHGLTAKHLTADAVRILREQSWPGNLRQLRNIVERACVLWDGEVLAEPAIRAALTHGGAEPVGAEPAPMSQRLNEAQRRHIMAVLHAAKGNKTKAAAHLGVSRRALYRWIDRCELPVSLVTPSGLD